MRRRIAFVALAGATAIAAACSVYTAESPYVDSTDASNDDGVSTPADGGADTSLGAEDAGDAGDAARFCERQDAGLSYCRDFDDDAPLFFGFASRRGEDGGDASFDLATYASPPRSFALTLPAGPLPSTANSTIASLVHDIARPAPPVSARFAFDMRVDNAPAAFPVRTAAFCNDPVDGYCAWIAVYDGKTQLIEQTYPSDAGFATKFHTLGVPIELGKWTRVELTFNFAPSPGITLTFDGYDTMPMNQPFIIGASGGTARFGLNATVYGDPGDSIGAVQVRYDNVVLDLK